MALRDGIPIVPTIILALVVIASVFAPLIAPYSPYDGSITESLRPPSWLDGAGAGHVLGTDKLGRDLLSRILFGARVSLLVSAVAVLVAGITGSVVGIIAGFFGGWVDAVLMRLTDLALSLPVILLALVLATVLGPSLSNVIVIVGILIWPRYARQARAETLSVVIKDYVAAARLAGCSSVSIIVRHVFPNIANTLVVVATFQVGWVILLEGSLSFLGAGVPPPNPTWGGMVADGRSLLASAWWVSLFPGIAIVLTVVAFNLMGDWLRARLDPKLRQI